MSWLVQVGEKQASMLSREEMRRYGRHLIMPEFGLEGQRKLKDSSVLIIGVGGLGSPSSLYLAAAGVGRIGLVDHDRVDYTNLQRQILYSTSDVGRPKLQAAAERLRTENPDIEIRTHQGVLDSKNALDILRDYDVILDGTDNFPTRYLVNDACVLLGKPNIYGSIFRFEGQASVFYAKEGPCYRCIYPQPPPPNLVPTCAEGGVLGVLPGIIGLIQATETVKMILGKGEPLIGRLLYFDALKMSFREFKIQKNKNCPVCGEDPTVRELIDYEGFCGITPERIRMEEGMQVTPEEVKERLGKGDPLLLVDVREPVEYAICKLPDSKLIPLGQLPDRVNELDSAQDIIMYCHVGMRSLQAAQFMREAGFKRVWSMKGGIEAWSERIDHSVPRY